MSFLFGGGKSPSPPVAVPAPKPEDKAVQDAAAEAMRRRRLARGFRSTVLSQTFLSPPALTNDQQLFTFGR